MYMCHTCGLDPIDCRTPRQGDEIYANGMVFLKCHLKLTQLSHQLLGPIVSPKL